jgi:hypothetical protein
MQPDGRGKYLESYEVSDLPEALERFEQLAADNAG